MAKKQTRRAVSVNRTIYERLKLYAEANNVSMSHVVEQAVAPVIGTEPAAPRPRKAPEPSTDLASIEREAIYG